MKKINTWLNSLENSNVITASYPYEPNLHHLNTSTRVNYPKEIIQELKDGYDPELEKGGFILFRPEHLEGETILTAEQIIWIQNTSTTPHRSYTIKTLTHKQVEKESYEKGLLPLQFHTHPMPEATDVYGFLNYLRNLNTSDADKVVSYNHFDTGERKLVLPDILVVGHGMFNSEPFIGMYNGLITPLDFEAHRDKLVQNTMQNTFTAVSDWADTDGKKALLFIGGLALLFCAIQYPKTTFGAVFGAAMAVPMISMHSQDRNEYFGIARPGDFTIHIPKVTDKIIAENRRMFEESNRKLIERNKLKK